MRATLHLFENFLTIVPIYVLHTLCMAEALGRIKGMWKKGKGGQAKLSMDEYLTATKKLLGYTQTIVLEHGKIEIDKSSLSDMGTHSKVVEIAREHKLDLSDALQLYTIKSGKYGFLCQDSASVLITADKDLAIAAAKMNIKTWNCSIEREPGWL